MFCEYTIHTCVDLRLLTAGLPSNELARHSACLPECLQYDRDLGGQRPASTPRLLPRLEEPKNGKNRLHLDLQPLDRTRDEEVERVVALGGTLIVIVMRPSAEEDCPEADRGNAPPIGLLEAIQELRVDTASDDQNVVRMKTGDIPAGAVVVLVPVKPGNGAEARLAAQWYAAPGPKCVLDRFES